MWTKTLSNSPSKAQAKAQPKALPLSQPILRWALTAALALMLSATAAAMAAPVAYQLSSGSATIRGTLAGSSESIFVGPAAIDAPIISARTVIDQDAGANGRVESIQIVLGDLNIQINSALLPIDTLNIFSPTISSIGGSDLNVFGQFAMQSRIAAIVTGTFPGGLPFGPDSIQSADDSGSVTGIVSISGDEIMIQIIGVTVASFEQIGSLDPNAPNIEVKADFTFRGVLENPIPEPSAALLFLVGASVAGSSIRRRR